MSGEGDAWVMDEGEGEGCDLAVACGLLAELVRQESFCSKLARPWPPTSTTVPIWTSPPGLSSEPATL